MPINYFCFFCSCELEDFWCPACNAEFSKEGTTILIKRYGDMNI